MLGESTARANESRRTVAFSAALLGVLTLFGMLGRWHVIRKGSAWPIGTNIYFRLYALYELPFLILLALFAVATAIVMIVTPRRTSTETEPLLRPPTTLHVALVALSVLFAGYAITHLVMHGLLFSMDEFTADFQARVFARGEYAPVVPWPWRSLKDSIVPIFVQFDENTGRWVSQYLPVYSLIKALFVRLRLESWLNPLLSAGSVVTIATIARRLWPSNGAPQWLAIVLLATSSQLLVTAGSGYSMPAHLFLNLVWLWLYLRGDALSWALALGVGVLALGLHQPVPHALFVAPFMLRLLVDRRWSRLGTAAIVYTTGAALMFAWMRFANPATSSADTSLLTLFALPNLAAFRLKAMNVSLLFSWQAPTVGVLMLVALAHPRRMESIQIDLALGIVTTVGFYLFYPSSQGHGWGYRYAYQVIGNMCLLASAALPTVVDALGWRMTRRWLATGTALALFIQIPMRLRDVGQFVRPFAAGAEYVRSRSAMIVLVRADSVWYGRDLIRNDPFLHYPIVVREERLSPSLIGQLKQLFPGGVVEVSDSELLALGMTPMARPTPMRRPDAR